VWWGVWGGGLGPPPPPQTPQPPIPNPQSPIPNLLTKIIFKFITKNLLKINQYKKHSLILGKK
jgi:hypothetical protein